jgi:hypothetical protein
VSEHLRIEHPRPGEAGSVRIVGEVEDLDQALADEAFALAGLAGRVVHSGSAFARRRTRVLLGLRAEWFNELFERWCRENGLEKSGVSPEQPAD